MNFIRNRKIKDGPQTSFEGFICPQNSDRQQKIRVFGRSPAGEGQVGQKQHSRAVTSFPLMVKGKAWLGIKDPPAGEGQVGQKQHCRAVTSFPSEKGRLG